MRAIITLIKTGHATSDEEKRWCDPPTSTKEEGWRGATWWGHRWDGSLGLSGARSPLPAAAAPMYEHREALEQLADKAYGQRDRWNEVYEEHEANGLESAQAAADLEAPLYARWCRGVGTLYRGYALHVHVGDDGVYPDRGDLIPWEKVAESLAD